MKTTSHAVTCGIRVDVEARYIPEQSRPDDNHWFFAYTIRIANDGDDIVQLIDRYWKITDANGKVEEVRGPGVVGQQPILGPGESHEYTSYCPLRTPFGTMEGTYTMVPEDGPGFDARIDTFALCEPFAIN